MGMFGLANGCFVSMTCLALLSSSQGAELGGPEGPVPEVETNVFSPGNWGIQFSSAIISENSIDEVLSGDFDAAEGDARGQLYSLTLSRVVHRFGNPPEWWLPSAQFEPYVTLTLVDEKGSSLFPDYNAGIGFRIGDFPWNRWVATTFYMGLGLSYSAQVYGSDRQRHPDEDRSHLKLDWPIQLSLALPPWPQHQLVLFNDHQSGGHIFDEGGVNSVGIGYRYTF